MDMITDRASPVVTFYCVHRFGDGSQKTPANCLDQPGDTTAHRERVRIWGVGGEVVGC